MTKISLEYNGNLRCKLIHQASNSEIITDAPIDNHGKGEYFSPTDMTAASLAACMITVLGIKNSTENLGISEMKANVEKKMKNSPRSIKKVKIHLLCKVESLEQKNQERIKEIAKNCPVALSLSDSIEQAISFEFTL